MKNIDNNFLNTHLRIQRVLLCILPISLILSIFIADLIVVILFFYFILLTFKTKNFTYFNNIYFKLFFFYWIYICSISFFSENIFSAFKSSFFYIRFIVLPLIILYSIKEDKVFKKYFLNTLLLIFIILMLDTLYEFLIGKNILGYGGIEKGRLVSFFKDEYVLGTYFVKLFFIIACLWFLINGETIFKKNLIFVSFYFILFVVVFLIGDRMPLLLLTLGTLIFFILSNYKKKIKSVFIFFVLSIIIVLLTFNQSLKDRYIKKTLLEFGSEKGIVEGSRLYKLMLDDGSEITFLTQHQNYLITAYKVFKENPIFGNGNKSFRVKCQKYKIDCCSCATHPHNIYLQLLAENGLIGFFYFFIIFLWMSKLLLQELIKKMFKKNHNSISNSKLCIIICIFLNLWPIAQTGNLFNNWSSIIYFLPVAFFLNFFDLKIKRINTYTNS